MTERQRAILEAVINEFMKEAGAVGSMSVVSEYDIGVSPATVRHEMVELSDQGYLSKSHLSSGREPTDLGLKFFVKELMEEEKFSNTDEVDVRINVFNKRFDEAELMRDVMELLASETGGMGISLMGDKLRHSRISSLLRYEELRDVETVESILSLVEGGNQLSAIFSKCSSDDVCVVIGGECSIGGLCGCALVFKEFKYIGDKRGYLGVLGPRRMRYSRAIPAVRTVAGFVENAVRGW